MDERGLPDRVFNWETIDANSTTGSVFSTGEPVHIRDWDEVSSDVYPNSQARGLRPSHLADTPHASSRRSDRRHHVHPGGTRGVRPLRAVAAPGIHRPGSHRRRQRPAPAGDRTAQHRTRRVAGTPDGDQRGARVDQRQPWRPRHGARRHPRQGDRDLRRRRRNGDVAQRRCIRGRRDDERSSHQGRTPSAPSRP